MFPSSNNQRQSRHLPTYLPKSGGFPAQVRFTSPLCSPSHFLVSASKWPQQATTRGTARPSPPFFGHPYQFYSSSRGDSGLSLNVIPAIVYSRILALSSYGLIAKMRFNIVQKLKGVGAVSPERAVTPQEAKLSLQERQWLRFLTGAFSKIRKTNDGRYYTRG
jgi:hypothetical protein